MKRHSAKGLYKAKFWDLGGSLNELGASSEIPPQDVSISNNWKVHRDGRTRIKRPGYEALDDQIPCENPIRGLDKYVDDNGFERIVVLSDKSVLHRIENVAYEEKYLGEQTYISPFAKVTHYKGDMVTWEEIDNTKGRVLKSSDGETWSELYQVTGLTGSNFHGYGIEEYMGDLFVTHYNSPNSMVSKWNGSTVTKYDIDPNYDGAFDMEKWDGKLWVITFVTGMGNDKWRVSYFNGVNWNDVTNYDGAQNIPSNTGNLQPELVHRCGRLFVKDNQLYLIVTYWDTGTSDWYFQVWRFKASTYDQFNKVYDSKDDSEPYGLSAIFEFQDGVYLVGSKLTSGGDADGNQQRVYFSTDMENWTTKVSSATLGFPFGEIAFPPKGGRFYVSCNFHPGGETKIWYLDNTSGEFKLEATLSSYSQTGDHRGGGFCIFKGDLFTGKARQILKRIIVSYSWEEIQSSTEPLEEPIGKAVWGRRFLTHNYQGNLAMEGENSLTLGIIKPLSTCSVAEGAAGDITGTYKYVITYYRSGNYPCESNPSAESAEITVSSKKINLSNIPISPDPKVNARRIYRTFNNGEIFYWLADINDNTTTTYEDNYTDADIALSDEVSYDRYPPPLGKYYEVWDNKLWIAGVQDWMDVENTENLIFYTNTGTSEEMGLYNFIPFRKRESEKIMQIRVFGDYLYVFKRKSMARIAKVGDNAYELIELPQNIGTDASWSVAVCDKLMMWKSEYGIEVFNGQTCFRPVVSELIRRTMATINENWLNKILGGHNQKEGEYWLSVPTGTSDESDKTIVFDYINKRFHGVYSFADKITAMAPIDYKEQLICLLGTPDGHIFIADKGYTDNGSLINANFATGWLNVTGEREIWNILRRLFIKYILSEVLSVSGEKIGTGDGSQKTFNHTALRLPVKPSTVVVKYTISSTDYEATDDGQGAISGTECSGTINYTTGAVSLTFTTAPDDTTDITIDYDCTLSITMKFYKNWRKDAIGSISLYGKDPSSGGLDEDLRREVLGIFRGAIRAYYIMIEFINNQEVGGECRIIGWNWYFKRRIWKRPLKGD